MLLALLVGILAYSAYTQKQIYQESTANLLSTCLLYTSRCV